MKRAKFNWNEMRPGFWLGILAVLVLLILGTLHSCAQEKQIAVYDTVYCNMNCIQKYVSKSTAKTTRIYAVYVDKANDIMELIPVSKSVYDYILTSKEYGLTPKLGIRLRNGEIYSIVKLKQRMKWKK